MKITVDQMVTALCKARGIPNDVLSDSDVYAEACKEARAIVDALNEAAPLNDDQLVDAVHAEVRAGSWDVDPTAGLDPKFNWGGDP